MPDSFEGGCACEAIRYHCNSKPVFAFNCHCRACQRFTGSAFMSGLVVAAPAFRIIRGEPAYYKSRGDSGGEISRGFCASCGSPVVTRFSRMPAIIGIPAASLDDPSWHKPAMDIHIASAQPWDYMNPELPKFAAAPDAKR